MIARWIPSVVVPLLAMLLAMPYFTIEGWGLLEGPSGWFTPLWSAVREAPGGVWVDVGGGSGYGSGYALISDFAIAALAWHNLYLIGLIIASVVAFAKHGWTRRLLLAGVVGVGLAAHGAVMVIAAAPPWL